MASPEDEEKLLRSAAMQNANSVLLARRRAEDALRRKSEALAQSLAMMRATLEATTDGILVTNEPGEVTDFNVNFTQMWRLPSTIVVATAHRQVLNFLAQQLTEPARFLATLQEIAFSAPPESFHILECADGRVLERYSRIQRVEGRAVGRVWSFRDITERRRAEQELRAQQEWFKVTLSSIGDSVITTDIEARVTFLNPIAEKMTGWTSLAARGQPLETVFNIVNEHTRLPAPNPVRRVLQEGLIIGLANHTVLIARNGTEVAIEDSAAPIKDVTGKITGAVMVFHDVTARRKAELELRRAQAAAELANKTKDDFLAALSHELRTPLTPVLAILSSVGEDYPVPPALAADLETVRRNVELETRLIDDLLDLTRITRGKLELHSERAAIGQIIQNAIETCLPDLRAKQLTLVRDIAAPRQTIAADSARITQVLWNLLKNSIKFTPAGGTITVRSRTARTGRQGQVIVVVEDTGIGMEAGQLGGVFDAFEQGSRKITQQFGGLGLGLAIGRAIVEAHQGTIAAASAGPGCGSVFTVTLPCEVGEELKTGITAAATSPVEAGTKPLVMVMARPLRILLVEDHVDTAKIIVRLVSRSGHEVVHADSVAAALEIAEKEMRIARLDLVISDLGLPDGSGLELMRELSSKYGLRGIALSGFGMDSDRDQSVAAGFSRHLTKPIDIAALRSVIAELTQGA